MSLTDDTPPARLPRAFDPVEVRVLGALLEKQQATPEYYPLTLHALLAACNQKTNRDPVVELSATEIEAALGRLREHVLVWKTGFSRAEKWEQNVEKRWQLDAPAKAVMTLLLLRGEQTPGELRGRSDRLHPFTTTGDVEAALAKLAAGPEPLVAELPRRPGQKEARWTHLVAGPVAGGLPASTPHVRVSMTPPLVAPEPPSETLASRVATLEERLDAMTRDLSDLKRKLEG
jgi:uncharacterized protein